MSNECGVFWLIFHLAFPVTGLRRHILCDSVIVRLVSSGRFDNFVEVNHQQLIGDYAIHQGDAVSGIQRQQQQPAARRSFACSAERMRDDDEQ